MTENFYSQVAQVAGLLPTVASPTFHDKHSEFTLWTGAAFFKNWQGIHSLQECWWRVLRLPLPYLYLNYIDSCHPTGASKAMSKHFSHFSLLYPRPFLGYWMLAKRHSCNCFTTVADQHNHNHNLARIIMAHMYGDRQTNQGVRTNFLDKLTYFSNEINN